MPRTSGSVTERVVNEVANATDRDALELPPLYDAVDPDALDAFVAGMQDGLTTFTYADRSVTVFADGSVEVAGASVDRGCVTAVSGDD